MKRIVFLIGLAGLVLASVLSSTAAAAEQLVRVNTPTQFAKQKLTSLGLDLTEHGGPSFVEVVLHDPADGETLRTNGFSYTMEVPDLAAQAEADRRADVAYAARTAVSPLPSGRDSYRFLQDYENDMAGLVAKNPDLVKPISLPFKTHEGRVVKGIEITNNVNNAADGKPVFLQMGVHHAREWPSGEHAIEFAFDLVNNYGKDPRTTDLVNRVRTIVIPIVNPDGFNLSRTVKANEGDPDTGDDRVDENAELVRIVGDPTFEFKRKNCRRFRDTAPCETNRALGVDPNRNYGAFWGGPGSSGGETSEIFRGPAPFSEPETQNIRDLVSKRHVTMLITNHTFSNLVLRPPGVATAGDPPDEAALEELGGAMTAQNGYRNIPGFLLYDTTGTTEDWTYNATGGFGYTFEIGRNRFHPVYESMVNEYTGKTARSRPGAKGTEGGNREAYYIAMEAAANPKNHSVVTGSAAPGRVLRVRKTFQTPTSEPSKAGDPKSPRKTFTDNLNVSYNVPASGNVDWHINPSTRPLVAGKPGREPVGPPSAAQTFAQNETDLPCADADTELETCKEDNEFTVPGRPDDNGFASVRIEWGTEESDWDLTILRVNADGSREVIGQSAQGGTNFEQFTIKNPTPGGKAVKYIARVVNWAAAEPWKGTVKFESPKPAERGIKESWTLSCETADGTVLGDRPLEIDRGERFAVDIPGCAAPAGTGAGGPNAGAPDPGAADLLRPVATLQVPRISTNRTPSTRIPIKFFGQDDFGIRFYRLQVRELGRTGAAGYRTIFPRIESTRFRFSAQPGRTYQFRLRAVDLSGKPSKYVTATMVVPIDQESEGVKYRRFREQSSTTTFGGTYRTGRSRGATLSYVFRGGNFSLIGLKSRLGGLARVTLDGKSQVIDTYAPRTEDRAVLFQRRLKNRQHRLKVTVLGRRQAASGANNVRIDALSIFRRSENR